MSLLVNSFLIVKGVNFCWFQEFGLSFSVFGIFPKFLLAARHLMGNFFCFHNDFSLSFKLVLMLILIIEVHLFPLVRLK